jgi:hypothetical protein
MMIEDKLPASGEGYTPASFRIFPLVAFGADGWSLGPEHGVQGLPTELRATGPWWTPGSTLTVDTCLTADADLLLVTGAMLFCDGDLFRSRQFDSPVRLKRGESLCLTWKLEWYDDGSRAD